MVVGAVVGAGGWRGAGAAAVLRGRFVGGGGAAARSVGGWGGGRAGGGGGGGVGAAAGTVVVVAAAAVVSIELCVSVVMVVVVVVAAPSHRPIAIIVVAASTPVAVPMRTLMVSVVVVPVMMLVLPATTLPLFPLARHILPRSFEQQAPSHGIVHQRFVSSLFLLLNRQHRILPNLARCVPRRVRILQRHKPTLIRPLLQLLIIRPLDQRINPSLAKQVPLHFFSSASLAGGGAGVHPVDPGLFAGPASGLLHFLKLFDLALLLQFFDAFLGAFALLERFLLFVVDPLLVGHEHGVP